MAHSSDIRVSNPPNLLELLNLVQQLRPSVSLGEVSDPLRLSAARLLLAGTHFNSGDSFEKEHNPFGSEGRGSTSRAQPVRRRVACIRTGCSR